MLNRRKQFALNKSSANNSKANSKAIKEEAHFSAEYGDEYDPTELEKIAAATQEWDVNERMKEKGIDPNYVRPYPILNSSLGESYNSKENIPDFLHYKNPSDMNFFEKIDDKIRGPDRKPKEFSNLSKRLINKNLGTKFGGIKSRKSRKSRKNKKNRKTRKRY
jgi:hypothetical protein